MTLEEFEDKNYLLISPTSIQGGATLVDSFETLELYENMNNNTEKFVQKLTDNLIKSANDNEVKEQLNFNLIFCGDFDELPKNIGSLTDLIQSSKERIIAVYSYLKSTEKRELFVGFDQFETIKKYGYIYLSLAKLLEEFEKNNIEYEIDTTVDRLNSSIYRNDTTTRFVISYCPKKEIKDGPQLKKEKSSKI